MSSEEEAESENSGSLTHILGRGLWGSQEALQWQGIRCGWDLPSDAEGSGHCWAVFADTPIQCHVEGRDSSCGVADWGCGPHFQKVGPEGCTTNYQGITLLSIPGKLFQCWKGGSVRLSTVDNRVPRWILWGLLPEYGVPGPLLQAIRSLYNQSESYSRYKVKHVLSVGLCQGCPLSPILFVTFMDRISIRVESVLFWDLRIASLLFADDVVLLASSDRDLQHTLWQFAAECEAVSMRVSTSMFEAMVWVLSRGLIHKWG